jgi:hypothetical protein
VSDSQASATSAWECPTMPAISFVTDRKTFTTNPVKVARKLR